MGHLVVPFCFLSVHLTNRRYGPSYAFAQVVVSPDRRGRLHHVRRAES